MRYLNSDGVKKFLTKYSLDFTTEYTNDIVENYIEIAENWIDSFCNRTFSLRKYNEVQNGNGSFSLIVKHYPILTVDKIVVRYYPLSVVRTFTDGDGFIIIDRSIGKISIRPSFALVGAFPPDYAQYYAYIFPRGESNVNIQYWAGFYMVGDNKTFDELGEKGFYDVMFKSEDETKVYFDTPYSIGSFGWKMFKGSTPKDLIDDTSNWTLINSTKVSIIKTNFDNNMFYRLVYIPAQIEKAGIMLSAAKLLSAVGGRDDSVGGAGVQSLSVSGFSESYGDMGKWGAQIKQWEKMAEDMLSKYRIGGLSLGR
jgi:hypothetical protein